MESNEWWRMGEWGSGECGVESGDGRMKSRA